MTATRLSLFLLGFSGVVAAHPPPEATSACANLQRGSSCVLKLGHSTLGGQCQAPALSAQLVCVPENRLAFNTTKNYQHQGNGSERRVMANHGEFQSRSGYQRRRAVRKHTTNQSQQPLQTIAADSAPIASSRVSITLEGDYRVLRANGVAAHTTGAFPNRGNPHRIREQNYVYRIPANPELSGKITPLGLHNFGLAVNGVPFDPGAAEWFLGDRNGDWQYEALSGAVPLGVDENHAHVQPSGAYHYHGLPTGLLSELDVSSQAHSPIVGWAADGFPIYALYGYQNRKDKTSAVVEMTSSHQLRSGSRPDQGSNPGGHYDGTFLADYEYIEGSGTLDECQGRITVTPDFPEGTYAYFLTEAWAVIPRCYKGTPSKDFVVQRGR
ncbi:hypothetical protein BGP75_13110 [Motiliproteus sp. MSK22-1]|nr:hypothetical protein BGP75_13110 [Motiliproteus sp. MSK22-1]